MNIGVFNTDDIEFPDVAIPDVDLRVDPEQLRAIVRSAEEHVRDPSRAVERGAWAVVAVMGHARLCEFHEPDPAALGDVADWMTGNLVRTALFWNSFNALLPRAVPALALAIVAARPNAVAWAYAGASWVQGEQRAEIQRRLASYPLDSVREHYFALLGKHSRLLPPGTIPSIDFAPSVLTDVLRIGITDAVPAVRERAVAVAIGMNVVRLVRDEVLRCVDHEHEGVRQYAIVALGTLDDSESLARIVDKLDTGTQPEMTSAIWALARRPDGLARVLTLATDSRDWVRTELLYALAGVAAPMTDEQLAALTHTITDERLARVLERHLDRTRRGAPEYGPDGGAFVVRATGDAEQAVTPE